MERNVINEDKLYIYILIKLSVTDVSNDHPKISKAILLSEIFLFCTIKTKTTKSQLSLGLLSKRISNAI